MSRFKLATLMTTAALSLLLWSGLSSSTALANFTLEPTLCGAGTAGVWNFCWETIVGGTELKELIGEENFTTAREAGTSLFLSTKVGEIVEEIACSEENGVFVVLQPEPLVTQYVFHAPFKFTGCKLEKAIGEKCKVPTTIETKQLTGNPTEATEEEDVLFKPATGETVLEIHFEEKSGCPIVGTDPVKGEQLCFWLHPEILEDKREQLLECPGGGSKLTIGKVAVELQGEFEVTANNLGTDAWDIILG